MKKKRRNLLLALTVTCSIQFVMFFLYYLFNFLPGFYGFAVDAGGTLYIGSEGCVTVVGENKPHKKVWLPLYRGNLFSIIDGDKMAIQKGNRVFYYTLWGEELFSENQERSIRPQTDIFETATGKRYTLKSTQGYYQIFLQTKKGVDLVYARPIFEYFGCVLLVLCIPVNFILIFMLVLNCLLDPAFETQYDLFAGHKRHPS